MCRFFNVSRSGYYGYVSRMETPAKDLPLAEKIKECQEKCGKTYGYRRVHIWLERQGIHRNPKTILCVMQKYNLLSVVRRKKYRSTCQLSEICLTTVLSPTKPELSRISILYFPQLEKQRKRKKSLQSCSSTVTKAFSILHTRTLS